MAQDNVPPLPRSSSNMKGCVIGCLIVFIVGLAGTGLVGFMVYRASMDTLNAVTETTPRPVPEVTMTDEERAEATAKRDRFMKAVKSGEGDEKVYSFTGQEVNVMLRSDEKSKVLGDSVYVTIVDGEVHGEVSLDIGTIIPIEFFKGRYANGAATFNISAHDGRLFVFVEDFRVKGEDAPPSVLEQLRQKNLAEDSMNNPDFRKIMQNVESVTVEGDRLVVTLK